MNRKDFPGFIKKVIFIDLISVVIIILYWWIKGPRDSVHLINCLSVGGLFLIIPGFLVYKGPRSKPGTSFNKPFMPIKIIKTQEQLYRRTAWMFFLAGALLIIIGLLIYAVS